jgi:hypothetical protein
MPRRRVALLAVAAVLVLLFGGRWVALRYTEHAWFAELGESARFWTLLGRAVLWQVLLLLVSFAWFAAQTFAVERSIGAVHVPSRVGNLEIAEAVPRRLLRLIAAAVAALLALATTYTFSDLDHFVALYRADARLGLTDPVLQRDAGYYLTRLPLLEVLQALALSGVALGGLIAFLLYAVTGSAGVARGRLRLTPWARAHAVVLLAALALVLAWGFHLDAHQLVGGGGHDAGALSAVDRAIRLPAANALALIALLTAVGTALALRWPRIPMILGLWATLVVATLLGRLLIPALADAWHVGATPTVSQALAQYRDGYSRSAFGLLDVPGRPHPPEAAAPAAAALATRLSGLDAWSGEPGLLEAALGGMPADTGVPSQWVTGIRLPADGRPTALAVSQTDVVRLRGRPRPRWTELHRGRLAWGGAPVAVDLTPRAGPLPVIALEAAASSSAAGPAAGPRIRFLPRAAELGIVGPDESAAGQAAPGVLLDNRLRRLLLAWALQSPPLLDDHTSDADRVLYWRDVPQRLARLYPFAAFDAAQPVLVDGRLVWVADAYLASTRYPLAQRLSWHGDAINFLTAAYVATVDAETGRTRLYLRPSAGAFALRVAGAEHVLPLPPESLPSALRDGLPYPQGLFGAQVAMLARRGEGPDRAWALAADDTAAARGDAGMVRPAIAALAIDGDAVRLWSVSALTDPSGTRTTALVAGAVVDGRPLLTVLRPQGDAPTPQAAAAAFGASPLFLAATAGLGGAGGLLRRGPVLVLPLERGLAYVQGVFASTDPAREPPRLAVLAVLAGGRIGVGTDPASSARSVAAGALGSLAAGPGSLQEARAAFQQLDSARQRGDWEAFGRAWTALRRALGVHGTPEGRP